jgi:RNA polymerase-interacting CarD/CdnL/TRCF family regulator
MNEQDMSFQVGDQVIHWVHGLGEIIQLDEKVLSGNTGQYYVVQIRDLKLWWRIAHDQRIGAKNPIERPIERWEPGIDLPGGS